MPDHAAPRPDLWLVMAVIQEFRLDAVTRALEQLPGFGGMTVTDCRGFGRGKLQNEEDDAGTPGRPFSRARESGLVDFTRKVKLEVAVAGEHEADAVVETIGRAAHTGRPGDGKVFAWPIARAVRVRTFAIGEDAL